MPTTTPTHTPKDAASTAAPTLLPPPVEEDSPTLPPAPRLGRPPGGRPPAPPEPPKKTRIADFDGRETIYLEVGLKNLLNPAEFSQRRYCIGRSEPVKPPAGLARGYCVKIIGPFDHEAGDKLTFKRKLDGVVEFEGTLAIDTNVLQKDECFLWLDATKGIYTGTVGTALRHLAINEERLS